jgi:diguanylate cyclase (GGDEF)-like protein
MEAMRSGLSLSLILVAIDGGEGHSSRTRSTFEQAEIRLLAGILRRAIRRSDIVARHGPTSFAVIAQGTESSSAMKLAQRIQAACTRPINTLDGPMRVTVSQGIAALPEVGTNLDDLVRCAEEALALACIEEGHAIRVGQDREAPPESEVHSALGIPRRWHDAALFGSHPKRSCTSADLAAYLDHYPLLPIKVDINLREGEVAYLVRQARRGRGSMAGGSHAAKGPCLPLEGSFAAWLKQAGRPQQLPLPPAPEVVQFWDSGSFCLTNLRIVFRRRGAVDSLLLADIAEIERLQGGFACVLGASRRRLVILVPNAMQVGLCVARAMRDLRSLETEPVDAGAV